MRIDTVVWSDAVEQKLASKHRLSLQDVESLLFNDGEEPRVRRGSGETFYIYGQTSAGRYLWVCLAPKEDELNAWTLVTARDMTESERKKYTEWIGQ